MKNKTVYDFSSNTEETVPLTREEESYFSSTKESVEDIIDRQRQLRAMAYKNEADLLFFKWQREEITKEEWVDKIQEIKQLYPYPTE